MKCCEYGPFNINFLRRQSVSYRNKLECLSLSVTSTLGIYLWARLGAYRREALTGPHLRVGSRCQQICTNLEVTDSDKQLIGI